MRDLIANHEIFDEYGEYLFNRVVWKEDGHFYLCKVRDRKFVDEDVDTLDKPSPIPFRHIWAPYRDGLTVAPTPLSDDLFVKGPNVPEWDDTDWVAKHLLDEAEFWEMFKDNRHPNICEYHGCVLDSTGQFISGLCLRRYELTLGDAMRDSIEFDRKAAVEGIKKGLDYIHSLGMAHNDISPLNIMFDKAWNPVIIDFDSCGIEGERAKSLGTPGWSTHSSLSSKENDLFSLSLIERWLEGGPKGNLNDEGYSLFRSRDTS